MYYKSNYFVEIDNKIWVSHLYLVLILRVNPSTISSGKNRFPNSRLGHWHYCQFGSETYYLLSKIPRDARRMYLIPTEEEVRFKLKFQIETLGANLEQAQNIVVVKQLMSAAVSQTTHRYRKDYLEFIHNVDLLTKYSSAHALVNQILKLSNTYTWTELFCAFSDLSLPYTFPRAKIESEDQFQRFINKCLTNGIKRGLKHGLIGKKSNNLKLDDYAVHRIASLAANKKRPTKRKVYREFLREMQKKDPQYYIAYTTVCALLSSPEVQNIIHIIKYGRVSFRRHSVPTLNLTSEVNEIWHIDVTRMPFYINFENSVLRFDIAFVVDHRTDLIIGSAIDYRENTNLIELALLNAINFTGVLPAMIIHDNGSAFTSRKFKEISHRFYSAGTVVKRTAVEAPEQNGKVESKFSSFSRIHWKSSPGFIGSNLTSKSEEFKVSKKVIVELRKKKNLYSLRGITLLMMESILEHNNSMEDRKKSRCEKYEYLMSKNQNSYFNKAESHLVAYCFWNETQVKVRRNMIHFQFNKRDFWYYLPANSRNRLNTTRVRVYFNTDEPCEVHLFNPKEDFDFLGVGLLIKTIPINKNRWTKEDKQFHAQFVAENSKHLNILFEEIQKISGESIKEHEDRIEGASETERKALQLMKMLVPKYRESIIPEKETRKRKRQTTNAKGKFEYK